MSTKVLYNNCQKPIYNGKAEPTQYSLVEVEEEYEDNPPEQLAPHSEEEACERLSTFVKLFQEVGLDKKPRFKHSFSNDLKDNTSYLQFVESQKDFNSVDEFGNTSLMHAVSEGNISLVSYLLQIGTFPNSQNFEGNTALHFAASSGSLELVEMLIYYGASHRISNLEGASPLHFATCSGNPEVVRTLSKWGSYINQGDEEGDTPLHWAIRESREACIRVLIELGANTLLENEDGETPQDLAQSFQIDLAI